MLNMDQSKTTHTTVGWEGEMGGTQGPNGGETAIRVRSLSYMVENLQIAPKGRKHLFKKGVMQACFWQHSHKYQNSNFSS